jgi:hypothetical protein
MNALLARALNVIGWLCCIALATMIASFAWYLVDNNTNHTGLPLKTLRAALVALFIVFLIAFLALRKRSFAVALCLGLTMFAGLYYVDRNNIMLEYGEWIKRGMPERGQPSKST